MHLSHGTRALLLAGCASAALVVTLGVASAGGFAVREQSSEFQGMSFAGDAAAGGGLSGMFWNPAVAAYAPKGYSSESDGSAIFGHVTETAQTGSLVNTKPPPLPPNSIPAGFLNLPADSGNIAPAELVPASYSAYRINPQAVVALSVNSPFGLVTKVGSPWEGSYLERTSDIKTYDYTPSFAYIIAPGLSVGAGLQVEQLKAHLTTALSGYGTDLTGDDWGIGYTLGLNWMPSSATSIGVGYRSAISHNVKGSLSYPYFAGGSVVTLSPDAEAKVTLPDVLTMSFRQSVSQKARMMGTVEWTHWSVLQALDATCTNGAQAGCPASGATLQSLPFHWHDGWMFALGGEYEAMRNLTIRGGASYELSPIQDPTESSPRLPDQNRFTLSGGGTYNFSNSLALDLAYTHIWGLGGDINYTVPGSGTLVANVANSVDIISGAVKFKMNP